ncbi:MAG TPA: hypothetical protein DF637_07425 [Rikenellaceae bacterium]|nr:hypothetical protein [Rikenellaceae bacterium]
MRKFLLILSLIILTKSAFSNSNVRLEISGVVDGKGKLYISIFNSEKSFNKREIYQSKQIIPSATTVFVEFILPDGEYLISVYQDINSNKKLDSNIIGIPKEPVGISRYDGKGAPGNFGKHKIIVDSNNNEVNIKLHSL